jgi:hypothetical protein
MVGWLARDQLLLVRDHEPSVSACLRFLREGQVFSYLFSCCCRVPMLGCLRVEAGFRDSPSLWLSRDGSEGICLVVSLYLVEDQQCHNMEFHGLTRTRHLRYGDASGLYRRKDRCARYSVVSCMLMDIPIPSENSRLFCPCPLRSSHEVNQTRYCPVSPPIWRR